ncbi:MAG: CocE/NonD family hydrolase [Aphanocapsa lilacina HA4352-LM1]|jgi:putative CocE/NonD family hydrolase|nr:CocE/NonD family hydrolase [Aphanocapsa lilacina HA4352-LM1]
MSGPLATRLKAAAFATAAAIVTVCPPPLAPAASANPVPFAAPAAGHPRNRALYITARDGTKIALDVWLPENLPAGAAIPTIVHPAYVWRAVDLKDKSQIDGPDSEQIPGLPTEGDWGAFNRAGYAVVLVDVPGTGASFGNYGVYPTVREIQEYRAVVDWIVSQPWSNRKVGAYGYSGAGNFSEFLAAAGHPAVKAVVPLSIDFDPYAQILFPGGLFNERWIKGASERIRALNLNDLCLGLEGEAKTACQGSLPFTGVKPVDADTDRQLLSAAVEQHTKNPDFFAVAQKTTYRDELLAPGVGTLDERGLYRFRRALESSGVALFQWGGWFDFGVADGVLGQFATFKGPYVGVIGPFNHPLNRTVNPYAPPDAPIRPSVDQRRELVLRFFDAHLQDTEAGRSGLQVPRVLHYYTLGEERWKTTRVWPPKGAQAQPWYLAAGGSLQTVAPKEPVGEDVYAVDFEATSGPTPRWNSDSNPNALVAYDRTEQDKRCLTYTSAPLAEDTEITGHPVVTFWVTSTETDGAFYAYLEEVDEAGQVTYLSEGQLRVLHRKISTETSPYRQFGPYHSFKRADGIPLVPGKITRLSFKLLPTSALVRKGHKLRLAIAGHDKDNFARYPAQGDPVVSVERNAVYASRIDLPVVHSRNALER